MKNTRKILALVLVLMMVLPMFTMFTASAATPATLYLQPGTNWKSNNTWFAAYFFGNGEKWIKMTDTDNDGIYEVAVPAGYPKVIFCRMNPASSSLAWSTKWDQTVDIVIPTNGNDLYTIPNTAWNNATGSWSKYIPPQQGHVCVTVEDKSKYVAPTCTTEGLKVEDCTAEGCENPHRETTIPALGHKYTNNICTVCGEVATYRLVGNQGLCNGVDWGLSADVNKMTRDPETGIYSIVVDNVAAGTYSYKVARDGVWDDGQYPASGQPDASVTVSTAGSVKVVWDPAKKSLTATPHTHEYVEGKCSCGAEDPTYVPPHTHNFVAGEIVAPTFDAEGYTTYTCSCGGSEKRDIVPALVAVAQVGDVKYADIQEAIKAAAPAGTVELLCDVTVEEWIMISEILTIGDGTVITLDMNGLTIDGNGHTLTINNVESAGNGNHIFYDGDYNVCDLTLVMGESVNGLGITSGTISNVTFIGGRGASAGAAIHVSDGIVTGVHAGNVTIEGCTFKNNGAAIYFETAQDNLVVNNNTFEIVAGANVIMFRGTERFTNNTVVSGRTVNVVSGSPVITGNDFGDVRLKVYNEAAATITNNTINNLVFNDESATKTVFGGNTLSEAAAAALAAVEHKEPAHEHAWSDATCTEGQKCECGETQGEALGHDFVEGVCSRCEAADPDYAPEQPPVEEPAPQGIFDMILAWIMSFIEMILGWFKF